MMKALLCLIFSLLVTTSAWATTYFVTEVRTSDANPELAKSLKSLITTAVTSAGGQVAPTATAADFTLNTDLVKLGQAYVLTVTKVKPGREQYASRQKAASVEELDDAADRAVRAAILETPAKKDMRVGEVKKRDEDQIKNRIQSRSVTYLGFGPAGFQNMGSPPLSYDLALGHLWEVSSQAAIKLLANAVGSGDFKTYFMMAQLGLNYYFTDEDIAPYIGGGLGFGLSWSGNSNATTLGGFAGNLGLGYEFFRTSSTQFDVFAGYSAIFGNNSIGMPGYYGLRIGILF
jgi:hypothetical protein